MKLIGKLKTEVDQAGSKEEKRKLIEAVGIALTDEELENVAGGANGLSDDGDPPFPLPGSSDHYPFSGLKRGEDYEEWEKQWKSTPQPNRP